MHQRQFEVLVLKPTQVFLSFLAAQLPETELPRLELLQTDNTAYLIEKKNTDEAILAELERHFPKMFRHEICRWLGNAARNEVENSFFDFLCCFKFELHSHIILMEETIELGHQALIIKPRSVLLNWIKAAVADQDDLVQVMERVQLSHIAENATVMVKNFADLSEIKPFIEHYYKAIFEASMSRMSNQPEQWPVVNSFPAFRQYFSVEIHTQLINLYS